jgi:Nucleotidyltransferase domain
MKRLEDRKVEVMSREHVDHGNIASFAYDHVNLKRDDAKDLREQVWRLRDKLEAYVQDHPDFELKKILLSGSLAKGTALKSINDIDVACYVSANKAPADLGDLIQFLAEKLRKAFPQFKPEQVIPNTYSVTVQFIPAGCVSMSFQSCMKMIRNGKVISSRKTMARNC